MWKKNRDAKILWTSPPPAKSPYTAKDAYEW
jgi:hypothetical protein